MDAITSPLARGAPAAMPCQVLSPASSTDACVATNTPPPHAHFNNGQKWKFVCRGYQAGRRPPPDGVIKTGCGIRFSTKRDLVDHQQCAKTGEIPQGKEAYFSFGCTRGRPVPQPGVRACLPSPPGPPFRVSAPRPPWACAASSFPPCLFHSLSPSLPPSIHPFIPPSLPRYAAPQMGQQRQSRHGDLAGSP